MGVGGADRLGRVLAAVGAAGGRQRGGAAQDRLDGQGDADQPGGAHEHLLGRAAELRGDRLAHLLGVDPARGAGGCVGVAAVEHDRRRPTAGGVEVGPGGDDRGGRHLVGGEHGRGGDRLAGGGGDEREVAVAALLHAAGDAGGDEALGRGDAHG